VILSPAGCSEDIWKLQDFFQPYPMPIIE